MFDNISSNGKSFDINKFKTQNEQGFNAKEIERVLQEYPNINMNKFNEALGSNTCLVIGDEVIHYKHDILRAIHYGIQNRKKGFFD